MQEAISLLEITETLFKANVDQENALKIIEGLKKISVQANQKTERYQKALHIVTSVPISIDESCLTRLSTVNPNKQYFASEIAEILNVSQKHTYKLLKKENIKSFKMGSKNVYSGIELLKLAKRKASK